MVSNGLLPSLLVFRRKPHYPVPSRSQTTQGEIFSSLRQARALMETKVAENRVNSLSGQPFNATRYPIRPGHKVIVCRENKTGWNGPYEVTKVLIKIISVTDGIKVKQFNITFVLSMPPEMTTI